MIKFCAHCGKSIMGAPASIWTAAEGTRYLHHEDYGPDCYRAVIVYGCTMPCKEKA